MGSIIIDGKAYDFDIGGMWDMSQVIADISNSGLTIAYRANMVKALAKLGDKVAPYYNDLVKSKNKSTGVLWEQLFDITQNLSVKKKIITATLLEVEGDF